VRLLLDEHLSKDIAGALRQLGHDVVAVGEKSRWTGLSDDEIIELARAEGRAVATNNVRDFRPRAAELILAGRGHPGMIFLPGAYRRSRRDVGRLVGALHALLEATPGEMENREAWL